MKRLVAVGDALVGRWRGAGCRHAGVHQKGLQVFDVVAGADAAVVRVVQEVGDAIQRDLEARSVGGLQVGAQVIEQGLDLAPVDVAGWCFVEDAVQEVVVFMAHVFMALS